MDIEYLSGENKYVYKYQNVNYHLEYIRNKLMNKAIKILYNRIGINSKILFRKIKTYISQMIMSIYTNLTFNKEKIIIDDPVFLCPNSKELDGFYNDLNYYIKTKNYFNDELRITNLFEKAKNEVKKESKRLKPDDYKINISQDLVCFTYKEKKFLTKKIIYDKLVSDFSGDQKLCNDYILSGFIRYDTFGSGANQYIIDLDFKRILRIKYNFDFECFASMFNHYYNNYCSIFYDIEKYFGSIGSIFTTELKKGCFMANPPYDSNLLEKMYEHIKKNMNNNNCIIYGVPKWENFALESRIDSEKLHYKKIEKHLYFHRDNTLEKIFIPPFYWYIFCNKEFPKLDELIHDLEHFQN